MGTKEEPGIHRCSVAYGNPVMVMSLPATGFGVPEKLQTLMEDVLGKWQCWGAGAGANLTLVPSQFLSEGYAAHLAALEASHRSRPKKNNSRMILRKGSFGLHAQPEFLRKRNHLRRTMSVQQPDPPAANPKPERAQSQPESDKDHERPLPALSWARGPPKFESVP